MYLNRVKKRIIVNFLFNAGIFITSLQGFLASSTFGFISDNTMAIIMGIISILSGVVNTSYQYLHSNVPKKVAVAGLLLSISSILGGFNELFKLIVIDGQIGIILTCGLSFMAFSMQLFSKLYYPADKKESADD